MTGRIAWDRILREVSLVLPQDVWLSSLTMSAPVPGSTELGTNFQISGSAYSHEGVARLLSRIALIPDLTNVLLVNSAKPAGKNKKVAWSITASIRQPGATS